MDRCNQKGSTMLEAMAVMAIIGVLAVSAFKLVYNLFDLFRQNVVTTEIKDLKKSISDRYAIDTDYRDLKTEDLLKDKAIPNQMISNGKIYHKLGGEVIMAKSSVKNIYFDITFKDLSQRGCMNLSQVNWIVNQNSDLIQMKINGKVFELPNGKLSEDAANALPMNMAKAAESCEKDKSNEITWTFQ